MKHRIQFGAVAILAALSFLACGGPSAPDAVTPSAAPPLGATHGSSLADVNATDCTVTGGQIGTFVGGTNTEGYISASDKGVGVHLDYRFLSGTNPNGQCPGPTRADWHFGNLNEAGCRLTGTLSLPFVRLDAANPGHCIIETPVFYPDGTSETVALDANVSRRGGVLMFSFGRSVVLR